MLTLSSRFTHMTYGLYDKAQQAAPISRSEVPDKSVIPAKPPVCPGQYYPSPNELFTMDLCVQYAVLSLRFVNYLLELSAAIRFVEPLRVLLRRLLPRLAAPP